MFYTWFSDMKRWITALSVLICLAAGARAVEKGYQAGKIVSIQRKVDTRILYYLVNTPVTEDDPYYEVSVEVGTTIYRGLYRPFHSRDTLPDEWKPGSEVELKIEGRHFYVKRPNGLEVDFAIAKRTTASPPTAK